MFEKKGINPLISSILLLLVTVSIVSIYYNFASKYLAEQTARVDVKSEEYSQTCKNAVFKITNCKLSNTNLSITLESTGETDVNNIKITVLHLDGSITTLKTDYNIPARGIKTINTTTNYYTKPKTIKITPQNCPQFTQKTNKCSCNEKTGYITNELIHYWPLNDSNTDGWTADNNRSVPYDGQLQGGLSDANLVSSKVGNAYSFDGVDDQIVTDYNASFTTESFTIEYWFYANNVSRSTLISNRGIYPSSLDGFHVWVENGATIALRLGDGNNGIQKTLGYVTPSTWNHMAIVVDRNTETVKAYLNGVPGNPTSIASLTSIDNMFSFRIGGGWKYLNGAIDEVRIYNRALTPTEIKINYLYRGNNRCG